MFVSSTSRTVFVNCLVYSRKNLGLIELLITIFYTRNLQMK